MKVIIPLSLQDPLFHCSNSRTLGSSCNNFTGIYAYKLQRFHIPELWASGHVGTLPVDLMLLDDVSGIKGSNTDYYYGTTSTDYD